MTVQLTESEALKKARELKAQGNESFGKGEWKKAQLAYDNAMRVCPVNHREMATLHNNKAACHMKAGRWRDAVKECTNALRIDPELAKARLRRAKAYEKGQQYKESLEDYSAINKTDAATQESIEAEGRLRTLVEGRDGALAGRGANRAQAAPPAPPPLTIKLQWGEDTRALRVTGGVCPSYAQLREVIADKFPEVPMPYRVTYRDAEGEVITVRDRSDIYTAIQLALSPAAIAAAAAANRGGEHGPKLPPPGPSVRLFLERVASAEESPVPPESEIEELKELHKERDAYMNFLKQQIALQAEKEKAAAGEAAGAGPSGAQSVELDEWLVSPSPPPFFDQFATLFRDATGIDFDRHVELSSVGYEKLSQAAEAAITSDAAVPLFHQAIDKFKEQAAMGVYNWGSAHHSLARKYMDDVVKDGAGDLKAARAHPKWTAAHAELDLAEAKLNECFGLCENFYDALVGLASLYHDRAKITAGYLIARPPAGLSAEEAADAEKKITSEALGRLKAADVAAAGPLLDKAMGYFQKAYDTLPQEARDKLAARTAPKSQDEVPPPTSVGPDDLAQQALILLGNVKFDLSQYLWATGADVAKWKALSKEAADLYVQARCPRADIRTALSSHPKADPELKDIIDAADPPAAKEVPAAKEEGPKGGVAALPKKK